jgi:hypothetical protein
VYYQKNLDGVIKMAGELLALFVVGLVILYLYVLYKALVSAVNHKRVGWVVVIFIFPLIGAILYLLVGE